MSSLRADFYKLRHTQVLWIHLLIPIIGAAIFLTYYNISIWSTSTKLLCYFQILAIAFPLLIGLICSMVISQEEHTGNFQEMFTSTKWKGKALLSKFLMLIIGQIFSTIIALTIFGVGFKYILGENNFSIHCYFDIALGLILGNILLYIFHLYLSLKFGKGISIGVGIVGSVISALMLTGLGDKIWKITPWAWGVRLCNFRVLKEINLNVYNMFQREFNQGIIIMTVLTFISLILILFWFSSWEGRKSYE